MTQYLGGIAYDDDGVLQTTTLSFSSAIAKIGGWAIDSNGDCYINDLQSSAVPATATFRGPKAFDGDGVLYVTSDTPSGAQFHGGVAYRQDGAMHVSTSAPQTHVDGAGLRNDGAVCCSNVAIYEVGDALLLETGDFFLLENGDKLLLEG